MHTYKDGKLFHTIHTQLNPYSLFSLSAEIVKKNCHQTVIKHMENENSCKTLAYTGSANTSIYKDKKGLALYLLYTRSVLPSIFNIQDLNSPCLNCTVFYQVMTFGYGGIMFFVVKDGWKIRFLRVFWQFNIISVVWVFKYVQYILDI